MRREWEVNYFYPWPIAIITTSPDCVIIVIQTPVADQIKGKYTTICEKELTINYEGASHTVDAGIEVKHAQLGDFDHSAISDLGSDYILQAIGYQVYWSKHDPTNLYFSMGFNPDVNNPTEGLFLIAEVRLGQRYRRAYQPKTIIIAPTAASKPETLVVLPSQEVHQMIYNDGEPQVNTGNPDNKQRRPRNRDDIPDEETIVIGVDDLGLAGYENFQYINDILMILNPTNLYLEKNGGLIYFMQSLLDGSDPDLALWNFLIKMEVYDRAGRPPINMATSKPATLLSDDEADPQTVSESDYLALPTFWHPGAGFTQNFSYNFWRSRRIWLSRLNISRATSLILWAKT